MMCRFDPDVWFLCHFNLPILVLISAQLLCCRYIQSTCATSGEGLYEGLDWLSSNIASKVSAQAAKSAQALVG